MVGGVGFTLAGLVLISKLVGPVRRPANQPLDGSKIDPSKVKPSAGSAIAPPKKIIEVRLKLS